MKNKLAKLVSLSLHLGAMGAIGYFFWPMARWYFEAKPLWGVDFYYTTTLVNLLKDNFTLPPLSWNYAWFAGWANFSSHPILHYYAIVLITNFFDLITSVKIWMLVSLGMYFLGIYAASYALSRNRGLAIILAIAAVYSVGVYGTLMWGGSLPSHASQAFFPWTLFLIIRYLQSANSHYLFAAGMLGGLAILGHPLVIISYIIPASAIVFVFSVGRLKFLDRIKSALLFVALALVVGLPLIYSSTGSLKSLLITDSFEVASSTARMNTKASAEIIAFHRAQPKRIYIDTNQTIFILLAVAAGLYILLFIFRHGKSQLFAVIPYLILAVYFIVYVVIFSYGISIFHGGWYRLFWATPLWLGLITSALWGVAQTSIQELLGRLKAVVAPLTTFVILIAGGVLLTQFSQGVKEQIVPRSNPSSAFPDVLNLRTGVGFTKLKQEMAPEWLDGENVDYRMYDGDQTVNIWWNAIYKMPLARGYLDPPNKQALGYRFWVDASLSIDKTTGEDQLVGVFNYPRDIAFNNTRFLVDWYSIKYFEGGRGGPTTFAPLPHRFTTEDMYLHVEELDFNKEKYNTGGQTLKFHELKDEYVSPIILSTSAPTLGIFATDEGYEAVIRALADANLDSRTLIPIKLGSHIDTYQSAELASIDVVFLYNYKYRNKSRAFGLLKEYIGKGGKLFVDTGGEVAESQAQKLPEIFPIESSVRKTLGREWDITILNETLGQGVDFSAFDPPLFDDAEWKFSYPSEKADLRSGSEVILEHSGHPLIVKQSLGDGEVIWSGLNLPYHVIRFHNTDEVLFFTNIVKNLLPQNVQDTGIGTTRKQFISAQQRTITTSGKRGILFKEQHYPGWRANSKSGGYTRSVKIWSAGPAYPGFMYVSLPKESINKETTVTFTYGGSPTTWFFSIISFIVIVFIAEGVFLKGVLLGRSTRWVINMINRRIKRWWVKDDSE